MTWRALSFSPFLRVEVSQRGHSRGLVVPLDPHQGGLGPHMLLVPLDRVVVTDHGVVLVNVRPELRQ